MTGQARSTGWLDDPKKHTRVPGSGTSRAVRRGTRAVDGRMGWDRGPGLGLGLGPGWSRCQYLECKVTVEDGNRYSI